MVNQSSKVSRLWDLERKRLTTMSAALPHLHSTWNILLFAFHYYSTPIKFQKFNLSLLIQLRSFSSQFHRHFYIHQHNCLNLSFLLFANIIVKIFTCLFVWFATLFCLFLAMICLFIIKRSSKLFIWQYFGQICLNLSQFMRICYTVRGTLHVEHIGGWCSLFRRHEWVMWVWPIQSLESITSFLFLL